MFVLFLFGREVVYTWCDVYNISGEVILRVMGRFELLPVINIVHFDWFKTIRNGYFNFVTRVKISINVIHHAFTTGMTETWNVTRNDDRAREMR